MIDVLTGLLSSLSHSHCTREFMAGVCVQSKRATLCVCMHATSLILMQFIIDLLAAATAVPFFASTSLKFQCTGEKKVWEKNTMQLLIPLDFISNNVYKHYFEMDRNAAELHLHLLGDCWCFSMHRICFWLHIDCRITHLCQFAYVPHFDNYSHTHTHTDVQSVTLCFMLLLLE